MSSFQPIVCVCKCELTEFLAELTEFAVELSEFSVLKQYSRNSIPPVPHDSRLEIMAIWYRTPKWEFQKSPGGRAGTGAGKKNSGGP